MDMQRREVLKGMALSGLASSLLTQTVAAEVVKQPQSTPQDFAEARRVMLHTLMHGLEC